MHVAVVATICAIRVSTCVVQGSVVAVDRSFISCIRAYAVIAVNHCDHQITHLHLRSSHPRLQPAYAGAKASLSEIESL